MKSLKDLYQSVQNLFNGANKPITAQGIGGRPTFNNPITASRGLPYLSTQAKQDISGVGNMALGLIPGGNYTYNNYVKPVIQQPFAQHNFPSLMNIPYQGARDVGNMAKGMPGFLAGAVATPYLSVKQAMGGSGSADLSKIGVGPVNLGQQESIQNQYGALRKQGMSPIVAGAVPVAQYLLARKGLSEGLNKIMPDTKRLTTVELNNQITQPARPKAGLFEKQGKFELAIHDKTTGKVVKTNTYNTTADMRNAMGRIALKPNEIAIPRDVTPENFQQAQSSIKVPTSSPLVEPKVVKQASSGTQNRMGAGLGETVPPIKQTKLPKSNTSEQAFNSIPKNATREQVAASLPNRIDSFIQKTLGYSTEAPTGGVKQANIYTRTLRQGQDVVTRKVEQGLGSSNQYIRTAATGLQSFFKGLGSSPERSAASMDLRGGIASANDRAYNIMDSLYKSLGNSKASLNKINAVLDPSLSKVKVSINDLSPTEKQAYNTIREGLNLVHDTSYANGHISDSLYKSNRGKYVPRLYDVMEMPPEVAQFTNQGKKIANDLYKQRTNINDWKIENSLNDPVYGLGKRLAQVETNTVIKKYTDFLSNNPNLVSDIERPGFTKLSDSPAYGNLKGKYVLNSAAEDLKGFFFSNQALNNVYDVFRAYDRLGVRQLQKKLLTVFNPTTNVGNIVSDQVFGFLSGVDPLTLNKNLVKFKSNPAEYKQVIDYLTRKGIVGTDITRTDFVNKMGSINSLAEDVGKQPKFKIVDKAKAAANKVQSFYGGTDDVYKASAFKALLDKGYSLEEATRKVADGFQNYANVGKFYDLWAKTPVIGSAFIKFQGDLIRIIKNSAVNNPIGLIGFLGTLWSVARLSSKASGETDQNRITRENRFAAPMIPGLNIPLTWQTPWGEINAARYISPFYANNDTTNVLKMLPFVPTINSKKDVASNIAINANDPLLSTPLQLAVNRDFRGKPISDPNENKYQPSTLTPQERLTNQALFAGRAYTPPPINSAIDVNSARLGNTNMYGAKQSVPQALARLGGIKISQFGPQEAAQSRAKDAQFQQMGNEAITKQVSSVTKQLLKGEISQETARKRIDSLNSQKTTVEPQGSVGGKYKGKITELGGQWSYLDKNGNQQHADNQRAAEIAIEKISLEGSTANFKDLGDVVLRKDKSGTVQTMTKDQYQSDLYTAKLSSYKKNENYTQWLSTAEKQAQILQKQLEDPQTDELDKIQIQNKIDTLVTEYGKYKGYGGFKKGKAAKKIGAIKLVSVPKVKALKVKLSKAPKFKLSKNTIKLSKTKKSSTAKFKIAKTKMKFSKRPNLTG